MSVPEKRAGYRDIGNLGCIAFLTKYMEYAYLYGSVALLWHNAKVLALLKVKCEIQ